MVKLSAPLSPLSPLIRFLIAMVAVIVLQGSTPSPEISSLSVSSDFCLPTALSTEQLSWAPQILEGLRCDLFSGVAQNVGKRLFDILMLIPGHPGQATPKTFRIVAVRTVRQNCDLPWPVRGWISSGFGMRRHPITHRASFHSGIDIPAIPGTPVASPIDGLVTNVRRAGAIGRLVKIRGNSGLTLYFGHLSGYRCSRGQRVRRGQIIGLIGSSGRTTGPHLHFSIAKAGRYLNPLAFLAPR